MTEGKEITGDKFAGKYVVIEAPDHEAEGFDGLVRVMFHSTVEGVDPVEQALGYQATLDEVALGITSID